MKFQKTHEYVKRHGSEGRPDVNADNAGAFIGPIAPSIRHLAGRHVFTVFEIPS